VVHPRITHLILRNENLEWNIDADHLRRLHQQRPAVAVLDEPAREWSLDELASIAAVSRATLVRAFRRICGVPPWAFLTEVRLGIARNRIIHTADALGQIAADVGYQSEAALSRALQRHFSIRPGALRRSGEAVFQAHASLNIG
jgi:AraC-like DNA-binding protein